MKKIACLILLLFHSNISFSQKEDEIDRLFDLAFDAYDIGKYEDAIAYFNTLKQYNPFTYIPYLWQGRAYLNMTNYYKSIDVVKKGLKIEAENEELMNLLISNYFFVKDDKAILDIRKERYEKEPENTDYIIPYAYSLCGMGDFEKGCILLKKADKIKPNNAEILYRLGFYLKIINKKEEGISYLNQALELTNDDLTKSMILSDLDRRSEAIAILDTLISNNPSISYYYDMKGAILMEQSAFKEAKIEFEKANELQIHTLLTNSFLGYVNVRLENYDVIEDLELLTQKYPNFYALKVNYCRVLVETGKLNKAKEMIDDVISMKPLRPSAYYVKGLLYTKLNQLDVACINFNIANQRYFKNLSPTENLGFYLDKCN